MPLIKIYMYI